MGFYVRKSLRAGPFRFNVSNSGIGVSAGVPGFRVGTGPRGNYVHMGRGGMYYRATLPSTPRRGAPVAPARPLVGPSPLDPSDVVLHDVTGAPVEQLVPADPSELVAQLSEAAGRPRLALIAGAAVALVALFAGAAGLILLLAAIPLIGWLSYRDGARRSVVVFYDVQDAPAQRFQAVVDAVDGLARCQRMWFLTAAGAVRTTHQWKANSGASTVVSRKQTKATMQAPRHLVTNIAVPTLTAGRVSVHFLPDRVLLRDGKHYADIGYASLGVAFDRQRFIEDGAVPTDGVQVGTTWRFVNRNGSPDRRYNNNRQLPIMLYGRLTVESGRPAPGVRRQPGRCCCGSSRRAPHGRKSPSARAQELTARRTSLRPVGCADQRAARRAAARSRPSCSIRRSLARKAADAAAAAAIAACASASARSARRIAEATAAHQCRQGDGHPAATAGPPTASAHGVGGRSPVSTRGTSARRRHD